ncbi:biliverdin-producing heme oxygenase [Marinobacterium iners]|uniref:biliverdin-producing heme oxygenase n=1 Tax=Marinobacterium iners TaxID=48076 RepID=UPI001A8C21E0|nr:biliverdin-producing heme oxygenase [Marinobacterium iners]
MSQTTQPPSLHQQLRQATHAAHVRLNHHPLLSRMTRPTLDIETYTLILQAYWSFYQTAEAHIRNCLASGMADFNYSDRYKTEWLKQDLAHFGLTPGVDGCCPFTVELAIPMNRPELVGMMYPLEGSTLGGRVISRHLMHNLGINDANGGRFFSGYGHNIEQLWTQFIQFAERSPQSRQERTQACDYAIYLFETLEAFLDVHVS